MNLATIHTSILNELGSWIT